MAATRGWLDMFEASFAKMTDFKSRLEKIASRIRTLETSTWPAGRDGLASRMSTAEAGMGPLRTEVGQLGTGLSSAEANLQAFEDAGAFSQAKTKVDAFLAAYGDLFVKEAYFSGSDFAAGFTFTTTGSTELLSWCTDPFLFQDVQVLLVEDGSVAPSGITSVDILLNGSVIATQAASSLGGDKGFLVHSQDNFQWDLQREYSVRVNHVATEAAPARVAPNSTFISYRVFNGPDYPSVGTLTECSP